MECLVLPVLLAEAVDAPLGVDQLLLARKEGVRSRSDVARDHVVGYAVDVASLVTGQRGPRLNLVSGGDIDEDHGVVFWMDSFFHGSTPSADAIQGARRLLHQTAPRKGLALDQRFIPSRKP